MIKTTDTWRMHPLMQFARQLAQHVHEKIVRDLTHFRPGDKALINPGHGHHIAIGHEATVEKIDLDHNHAGFCDHREECYDRSRVEVYLVWGAKPDGSAALRTREHQKRLRKVYK